MSTQLVRGQITHDIRLGRIIRFDPRSKNFPVATALPTKILRTHIWGIKLTLDQGQTPSCVGHGFAHDLAAAPVVVKGVNETLAQKLYHQAQKDDQYPGENYDGSSVLGGARATTAAGYYTGYKWAFSLNEALLAVGYLGPVIVGINWYNDMFNPDSNNFIHPTGSLAGGHCLLVRGVNVPDKYVTLHNSWGNSWGQAGDVKLNFDDFGKLLNEQGEACVPSGRKK